MKAKIRNIKSDDYEGILESVRSLFNSLKNEDSPLSETLIESLLTHEVAQIRNFVRSLIEEKINEN